MIYIQNVLRLYGCVSELLSIISENNLNQFRAQFLITINNYLVLLTNSVIYHVSGRTTVAYVIRNLLAPSSLIGGDKNIGYVSQPPTPLDCITYPCLLTFVLLTKTSRYIWICDHLQQVTLCTLISSIRHSVKVIILVLQHNMNIKNNIQ